MIWYSSPVYIGEHHDLVLLTSKNEKGGLCCTMGKKRNECRFLVGKPEGKCPVGRPSRRWEDVKIDVTSIWRGGVDWINLAHVRER
jgi:hypothetical protein